MIASTEKSSGTYTFYDICIAYLWFQKYKENELVPQSVFFQHVKTLRRCMAFPRLQTPCAFQAPYQRRGSEIDSALGIFHRPTVPSSMIEGFIALRATSS